MYKESAVYRRMPPMHWQPRESRGMLVRPAGIGGDQYSGGAALLSNCSNFGHFVRSGGPRNLAQFLPHVAGPAGGTVRC